MILILAAIVTVYIILGVLYESYIHPVTILSTLPSAGLGALIALLLTGNDFGIVAVIGMILLIGIVTIALSNQRSAAALLQRRMTAAVQLIRAIGGGWDASGLSKP